jgi:hypothetical protein
MQKLGKAKKQLGLKKFKNLIKMTVTSSNQAAPSYTNINYANLKFTKQIKKLVDRFSSSLILAFLQF